MTLGACEILFAAGPCLPAAMKPGWQKCDDRSIGFFRRCHWTARIIGACRDAACMRPIMQFMNCAPFPLPGWPEEESFNSFKQFSSWARSESFVKSLSISYYADGDRGFAFVFPFFILKNLEDPMAGGFVVHRMILKDKSLRDFSWMLLYTPSASRWIDSYFSAGVEWDKMDVLPDSVKTKTDFVLETGIKFRVNITKAPAP